MFVDIFPSPHPSRVTFRLPPFSQLFDPVATNSKPYSMDVKDTLKNHHGVIYDPENAVILLVGPEQKRMLV